MIRPLLRAIAIAIAIAAAVDPAVSIVAATRPRIALVAQNPESSDVRAARAAVARDLAADYDLVPQIVSDAAAAIVIGDRYPDEPVADSLRVSTVTIAPPSNAVRVLRVSAPRDVLPATSIRVRVDVAAHGVSGRATEVRARIRGVQSGFASHRWTATDERWLASLDVVPIGEPPYVVHLEAATAGFPAPPAPPAAPMFADLVVQRRDVPLAIEFFDARPSWASTFVRRSLESDARFSVDSISANARSLSTRTARAVPLRERGLDAFAAVIVGGLDRLSANDVSALERYMRERGGAVVLLPDQRLDSGPLRAIVPELTERLLEQPATMVSAGGGASLRASELLVASHLPPGSDVLQREPGDRAPIVVTVPRGDGRLLVSGAMDAWRYRAAPDAAFDRFWRAAISGLALTTAPRLDVTVTPPIVRPGEQAEVVVRVRGGDPASISASAGGQPIRLAPAAEPGVSRARFNAAASGTRTSVEVRATEIGGGVDSATVIVPIGADAHPVPQAEPPLSLLSASHHGIDAPPARISAIEEFVRTSVLPSRAAGVRHPMRSPWWLAPFIACLSAEWWLRRRRGLR